MHPADAPKHATKAELEEADFEVVDEQEGAPR